MLKIRLMRVQVSRDLPEEMEGMEGTVLFKVMLQMVVVVEMAEMAALPQPDMEMEEMEAVGEVVPVADFFYLVRTGNLASVTGVTMVVPGSIMAEEVVQPPEAVRLGRIMAFPGNRREAPVVVEPDLTVPVDRDLQVAMEG